MPLFYFHLRENGTVIEDEEGMDLPYVGAAELEAVKSATEIARDQLPGSELRCITIDVRDHHDNHVLSATAAIEVRRPSKRSGDGRSRSGDVRHTG